MTFSTEELQELQADIEGRFRMTTPKSLILVGLMGAGKTALGKRLSLALSMDFVDSDEGVEHICGQTIEAIFAQHGEPYFRNIERQVIIEQMTKKPVILSTGGGAFCHEATRKAIKQKGISLWLDAEAEILLARIGDIDSRPLLKTGDPLNILKQLRKERYSEYSQADLYLKTGDETHKNSMNRVLHDLQQHGFIYPLNNTEPFST